ncbi:MAG TPA: hypothetical protein DIW47_09620 [Bacteroidetes bacterium]|nr:hypothetical protein [Bacteroidota bacterium]
MKFLNVAILFYAFAILFSCQENSGRPIKIYKLVNKTITDTLPSYYHLTETKTGWEEIITPRKKIEEDEVIQINYMMYWNSDLDTPLQDLEESCLVMLAVPDTVQTEKGEIVIREYVEECGPIDGLVSIYHSPVLGPLAAVYALGKIDVFEYPGYEAITSYILKKIYTDKDLTTDEIQSGDEISQIHTDTAILNELPFMKQTKDEHFYCLLHPGGDTIIKAEDFYHQAEVLDIDQNGFMDLRVFIFSNTPNQCDSYLFDPESNTFRKIEYCYLDIKKIKGTSCYFSYNSVGCSDENWESHLSKIENYRLVDLGYIDGQGCDLIIEIFKFDSPNSEAKTKIATLSYTDHIKKSEDKWTFIEKYWGKNYRRFE